MFLTYIKHQSKSNQTETNDSHFSQLSVPEYK